MGIENLNSDNGVEPASGLRNAIRILTERCDDPSAHSAILRSMVADGLPFPNGTILLSQKNIPVYSLQLEFDLQTDTITAETEFEIMYDHEMDFTTDSGQQVPILAASVIYNINDIKKIGLVLAGDLDIHTLKVQQQTQSLHEGPDIPIETWNWPEKAR